MPLSFRCPDCQKLVTVSEELAGLHGRCPACSAAILFPAHSSSEAEHIHVGPPPLPPSALKLEQSFTVEPPSAIRSEDWRSVRIGLATIYAGLAILTPLILVSLLMGLMDRARPQDRINLGEIVGILWLFGAGGALVAMFVGLCVCCTTSTQAGARGFALLSVICAIVAGICMLVYFFSQKALWDEAMNAIARGRAGPFPEKLVLATQITRVLCGLFGYAAHILFVLFLRNLARFFAKETIVKSSDTYLLMAVSCAVLNVFVFFLNRQENRGPPEWISQALLFAGIFLMFWLIGLIGQTKETIRIAAGHGQI